jgi:chorismate mutase/prephenate dehydratase
LDFEGNKSEPRCAEALEALKEHAAFIKILGSYPRAA